MSVTEVERKRELTDPAALTSRLVATGYRLTRTDREIDTYYSRPDRDFLRTVECLRLRNREGHAEITYKPPSTAATHGVDDVITKVETTVVLADDQQDPAARALLESLGMVRLCEVGKTRTTYGHPDDPTVTVVIDVVAGVGTFAETEVLSADADDAATMLDRVERQLHLDSFTVIGLPYRDLVLQQDRPGTASPR